MSKDPKGDQDVSRRRLLKKAALAVGAATSVVGARSALARSSDIVMDSAGRVLIDGAALATQRPAGSFERTAANNEACANETNCTVGSNKGCSNPRTCVAPGRAMQPAGASPKTNGPVGGKPVGGSTRK